MRVNIKHKVIDLLDLTSSAYNAKKYQNLWIVPTQSVLSTIHSDKYSGSAFRKRSEHRYTYFADALHSVRRSMGIKRKEPNIKVPFLPYYQIEYTPKGQFGFITIPSVKGLVKDRISKQIPESTAMTGRRRLQVAKLANPKELNPWKYDDDVDVDYAFGVIDRKAKPGGFRDDLLLGKKRGFSLFLDREDISLSKLMHSTECYIRKLCGHIQNYVEEYDTHELVLNRRLLHRILAIYHPYYGYKSTEPWNSTNSYNSRGLFNKVMSSLRLIKQSLTAQ